ncbi:hypothetical protein ALC57_02196 [Trachymyrmex cornetzi]|uniref:Uncharacterized protein n=1 Tax=Trachymyrmex cornetzi TaxID=471704 RepID=A0A195EKS1_9HYME|nr:hypothetical protein ALC57_02196 [Trachymyrmex cornetzi]
MTTMLQFASLVQSPEQRISNPILLINRDELLDEITSSYNNGSKISIDNNPLSIDRRAPEEVYNDRRPLITRLAAGWSVLANQRRRRDFACCSSLQSGVHPNGRIPTGLGIYCPSVPDHHLAER